MAFVGLANPYIAKLIDETTKKYSGCFRCGKAMTMNVTPNYNEAKLYADNKLSEYAKEFKDGNITLGTDRLPAQALITCFGHMVSDDESEVTYKADDTANNVGVGFLVTEMVDNAAKYVATVVYKVKFSESANDYTTKGENLEFKTPSIEGTIAALETGEWKTTKTFPTAKEADDWLKTTLGYADITEPTEP
ncbi:MAG: major tail protein [Lachnospiraceae bacterium]|nr:major tail protein [Lachnospiraceae bacterium]